MLADCRATPPHLRERVQFLDHQLPGIVAGQILVPLLPGGLESFGEEIHGFRPAHRLERSAFRPADHRGRAAAIRVVGNPTVLALRTEMPEIDRMVGVSADTHDPAILHGDVKTAAVGAQHAGRMHPLVRFAFDAEIGVDPWLHMIFPLHRNTQITLLTKLSSLRIPCLDHRLLRRQR